MDKNKAMLIGFLLSDGSIYYDKSKRTYCIQFTNKVDALLDKFKHLMNACFGLKNYHINYCSNAKSIRFFSKRTAEKLFQFSPSYRTLRYPSGTYPEAKIPEEILLNKELLRAFFQAFISCDGNVLVNPKEGQYRIEIACHHPTLRKQLSIGLRSLGFEPASTDRRVLVRGRKNARRFIETIGFLPESIVCNSTSICYSLPKNSLLP